MAGFLLFSTLNEGLPEPRQSDFPAFVTGAVIIAALSELALMVSW